MQREIGLCMDSTPNRKYAFRGSSLLLCAPFDLKRVRERRENRTVG